MYGKKWLKEFSKTIGEELTTNCKLELVVKLKGDAFFNAKDKCTICESNPIENLEYNVCNWHYESNYARQANIASNYDPQLIVMHSNYIRISVNRLKARFKGFGWFSHFGR